MYVQMPCRDFTSVQTNVPNTPTFPPTANWSAISLILAVKSHAVTSLPQPLVSQEPDPLANQMSSLLYHQIRDTVCIRAPPMYKGKLGTMVVHSDVDVTMLQRAFTSVMIDVPNTTTCQPNASWPQILMILAVWPQNVTSQTPKRSPQQPLVSSVESSTSLPLPQSLVDPPWHQNSSISASTKA